MNAEISSTDGNADWLIEEETPVQADTSAAPPWRVLIVDDDVDVHVVTKFALSNASFLGRRLSFLHAYSGAEAFAMLRDTPDVALVLLDVIMETQDAGLRAVRRIREELGNKLVRIVLRTGQPGQALEHSIIVDYDINDFWCKTDLTTRKLFTTVIAALRSYADCKLAQERIAALAAALEQARQLNSALEGQALMLHIGRNGLILGANDKLCSRLGCERSALAGQELERLLLAPQPKVLLAALAETDHWSGELRLGASQGQAVRLNAMIVPLENSHGTGGKAEMRQTQEPSWLALMMELPAGAS